MPERLSVMKAEYYRTDHYPARGKDGIVDMVPVISRRLHILFILAGIALFISGPALAFTANSLDITVDKSGDAIAVFRFSLEGLIENAIPQSMLEEELLKGLSTSSEPPELMSMDRSSATIRMKKFAAVEDVPTGTEYRTVTMNFKKAEIALQQSAVSTVISADFSPAIMTVTFPDSYNRRFVDTDILPALSHIIIDPAKAAAAVQTPAPPAGTMRIISSPEGIQVSIDGIYVGTAPDTFSDIPAGEHTLQFSKDGYEPVSKTVTVTEGQTIQVSVFLAYVQPEPTYAPGFAGILAVIGLAAAGIVVRLRK